MTDSKTERYRFALAVLLVLMLTACYERYPYFIQKPQFSLNEQDGGVYLTIYTPDGESLIRYTTDNSDPSETNGTLYESPLPLSEQTYIKATAYRSGYPAGPISEFSYDPESN